MDLTIGVFSFENSKVSFDKRLATPILVNARRNLKMILSAILSSRDFSRYSLTSIIDN